jgi:hypothetical protein
MIKEIRKNQMYPFLMLLVLSAMMGFQGWRTLLNNFAVEKASIDGFEIGVIQSFREVPGFLVFLGSLPSFGNKRASVSIVVDNFNGSRNYLNWVFPQFYWTYLNDHFNVNWFSLLRDHQQIFNSSIF